LSVKGENLVLFLIFPKREYALAVLMFQSICWSNFMKITEKVIVLALAMFFTAFPACADFTSGSIRQQVSAAIDTKGRLGKYDISIDVRQGEVTLDGQVASLNASRLIEEAARSVPGVREVNNNLYINHSWYVPAQAHLTQRPEPVKPSDSEISADVKNALQREANIDLAGLRIETKNGVVTIDGSRTSFRDIDRILSIALMVDGVEDIKSSMTVGGKPYPFKERRGAD